MKIKQSAGLQRVIRLSILLFIFAIPLSALAAANFVSDGGTFVSLEVNGSVATYNMSYSSSGTPEIDGKDLGVFSLADSNTLFLTAFSNTTLESGGSAIFGGRFAHCVHQTGTPVVNTLTNLHNYFVDLGEGREVHAGTNLNVNLLAGLTNGTYKLELYALAYGNFSPELLEDNNGSNYVATFTVTEDPLPEPEIDYTDNGKVVLSFTYTTNTGFGKDLYVVGNHSDVGTWDPLYARKLHWTSGNIWTGLVAVEAGWALEYKFITRTNSFTNYCDAANVIWMDGDNLTTNVPAASSAPYASKAIYYYSGWTNVALVYQSGQDTNWYLTNMTMMGAGRVVNEYAYYVDGIGRPGERITFVPTGYSNSIVYWDHSPATGGNYYTPLDVFFLQDGHIYNYDPPLFMVDSQIKTVSVVSSLAPAVPSRDIRIYTPRNYETNTWKQYPVLYLHDGQNVFQPGGAFGCWNADWTADDLISLGVMRETIIVAINNSTNRLREYLPPMDDGGFGAGMCDEYLQFIQDDIISYMQANYRVLTNADDTVTLGSSFGGIASIYMGMVTNVFGKVGPMSPSFWAATNFVEQYINTGDSTGLRIYMDCGTLETNGMWDPMWNVYNLLQDDGYVINDSLRTEVGCGHYHNEAAWAERLPYAYEFLLNIQDEANRLAQQDHPPGLEIAPMTNSTFRVTTETLKGQRYLLERTSQLLLPPWQAVYTSETENLLWSTTTLTDSQPPTNAAHYRVIAE